MRLMWIGWPYGLWGFPYILGIIYKGEALQQKGYAMNF